MFLACQNLKWSFFHCPIIDWKKMMLGFRYQKSKTCQRFLFQSLTTCQLLKRKVQSVSNFGFKKYYCNRFWKTKFFLVLKIEAKHFTTYQIWIEVYTPCKISNWKNSNSEVLASENCQTSSFAFKFLERVRNWKVYFFGTCHNLKQFSSQCQFLIWQKRMFSLWDEKFRVLRNYESNFLQPVRFWNQ